MEKQQLTAREVHPISVTAAEVLRSERVGDVEESAVGEVVEPQAIVEHASRLIFLNSNTAKLELSCIEEFIAIRNKRDLSKLLLPSHTADSGSRDLQRLQAIHQYVRDGNEFTTDTTMTQVFRTNKAKLVATRIFFWQTGANTLFWGLMSSALLGALPEFLKIWCLGMAFGGSFVTIYYR